MRRAWKHLTLCGHAQEQPAAPAPAPSSPPAPSPGVPPEKEPAKPVSPPGGDLPATPPTPAPGSGEPTPEERRAKGDESGTEIVVYLKDGKSLTGMLLRETREELVVRISGIETPIATSTIDRYQILPPILERYRQYRLSIGNDPDQIAMLVTWLQSREQLELALEEVKRLLTLDPHHKQGLVLKKSIESQIELREAGRARGPKATPDKDEGALRNDTREKEPREAFPLLSEAQIALVKVFEIDTENPPRVVISRETVTKLISRYGGSPLLPGTQEGRDGLYRKPAMEILDLMFRLKARDLYGEVQVLDQPRSMRLFRDEVQAGWLVTGCATNECHGGTDAGRLMLLNRKPRAEASAYTNFLILERYRLNDGTPLLNYEDPAKSPLLQMALPRMDSLYPHPLVQKGPKGNDVWRPLFRNKQERLFERAVEWMRSMYRPRPEYPIEYQPPRPSVKPTGPGKEPVPR
jgi:hypothetical protein